jgi:hypothetical protein
MDYDLGFFDQDVNKVEPVGENPFKYSDPLICYLCAR